MVNLNDELSFDQSSLERIQQIPAAVENKKMHNVCCLVFKEVLAMGKRMVVSEMAELCP